MRTVLRNVLAVIVGLVAAFIPMAWLATVVGRRIRGSPGSPA